MENIKKDIYKAVNLLKAIKENYEGTEFEKASLIDAWDEQDEYDDEILTSLFFCSLSVGAVTISRYNVLVNNKTNIIEEIGICDVDFVIDDKLFDCIDINDTQDLDEMASDFKERLYEVSFPLFLLPFERVVAHNEKEAKEKALEMVKALLDKTFDKYDTRPNTDDAESWVVKEIKK